MAEYQVIKNPQNILLKYEVWYKGDAEGQDSNGYLVRVNVCKPVASFLTDKAAEDYIRYQLEVLTFKGT